MRTTSAGRRSPSTESTSAEVSSAFAPGATTMQFEPSAATITWAAPVGRRARTRMALVSTASAASELSRSAPSRSSPTQPTIATAAPWRAGLTAWLAPLPPGVREDRTARTVSPGRGSAGTSLTESMLSEPTTTSRRSEPSDMRALRSPRGARHAAQLVPRLDRARGQPAEQRGPARGGLAHRRPVDRAEPAFLRGAHRVPADAAAHREDASGRACDGVAATERGLAEGGGRLDRGAPDVRGGRAGTDAPEAELACAVEAVEARRRLSIGECMRCSIDALARLSVVEAEHAANPAERHAELAAGEQRPVLGKHVPAHRDAAGDGLLHAVGSEPGRARADERLRRAG